MSRDRVRALAASAMLSVVAFVLAHELTFLATFGRHAHDGLDRTGHGGTWAPTVATILVIAVALGCLAVAQLGRLTLRARPAGRTGPEGDVRVLVWDLVRLWLRILAVSILLFIVSENVEHAMAGLQPPGLGVLWSEDYRWTLCVFPLVSLVVASVGALYRWRRDLLVARLAAAAAPPLPRHRSSHGPRPSDAPRPSVSIAGRHLAVRGPPMTSMAGAHGD